jgi:glycosyltransferase involved in cell wall biosynthesis
MNLEISIGIAIPCYKGHIPNLFKLLDSIEDQTRKPDMVCVSCSSTTEFPFDKVKKYSFPLDVIITEEKKNAAENRNIAIAKLLDVSVSVSTTDICRNLDYITFMDADDIMHPQRIEILLKLFNERNIDIILHNYQQNEINDLNEFEKIENENLSFRINEMRQHWSGCIEHVDFHKYTYEGIHHSQASVKREILLYIKYPEEAEFARREDCIFCHRVFDLPNIQTAYVSNKLSFYKPSGTLF